MENGLKLKSYCGGVKIGYELMNTHLHIMLVEIQSFINRGGGASKASAADIEGITNKEMW